MTDPAFLIALIMVGFTANIIGVALGFTKACGVGIWFNVAGVISMGIGFVVIMGGPGW